jgi:DNA mismatch repair ATPase MutS
MAMRDNISDGDSYFIVEIKSLKRILDLTQNYPCTCYIDEILRGTNTIERIAASASVLDYLHSQNCLCVAASHDIELTNILADKFDNYHFCEQVTNDGIIFDYKLKHGASTTRNAIRLLSFMGFHSEIIE